MGTAMTPYPGAGTTGLAGLRPHGAARTRSMLRSWATSFVALALTLHLLPWLEVERGWALVRVCVVIGLVGALLRPVLTALAVAVGGLLVLLVGVLTEVVVVYAALRIDPDVEPINLGAAAATAWTAAAIAALVHWVAEAGTDNAFRAQTVRQMRRTRRRAARRTTADTLPPSPGVLVVQLDGLPAPLLHWAVAAGNLPTLSRWVRAGSHRMRSWHTGVPATTPAAQAGLLHGVDDAVPSYRWYDKERRRLVVTARPRDAAEIERSLSTGAGLLAGGGVSVGNLFSGDASLALLTASRAALPPRSARGYATFFTSPVGFARALVLSVGEMVKEVYQARRQRRLGVLPRVPRGGRYVLLRAVTNVLLRDLQVALVADQMARGAPVVYVDFTDYDEVAHHAGPTRPEALRVLEGLDQVLATLEQVARYAARPYAIVVLSDHGQSQGATFRQRYGEPLDDVVRRLLADPVPPGAAEAAVDASDREDWGPVRTLLNGVTAQGGATGAAARAALRRSGDASAVAPPGSEAVVVASGNLAMVHLADEPGRVPLERIRARHPLLVDGLAAHPGVGFVLVRSAADGPVVIGADGRHVLETGRVEGVDPLARYGPHAADDLRRLDGVQHVGDLVVCSRLDEATDEVAAFEELVGSHGGLGGWQNDAVLVFPADWPAPADPLVGPVAVHRLLVSWLERLGHRRPLVQREEVRP